MLLLSSVVSAVNGLYISLGSPPLPGWTGNGGDPCGESWQGVVCTGSSITGMYVRFFFTFPFIYYICFTFHHYQLTVSRTMNAANLGGQLGSLGNFTSITSM
jgi:hypothetical protein